MNRKVFQLLVDNTTGVLSRISGLFSRRGYNIESITAGITGNPKITRITIVALGDEEILEQIEKQLEKLEDVRHIKELLPSTSVLRELCLIKVAISSPEERQQIHMDASEYKAKIIDSHRDSITMELKGDQSKVENFLTLLSDYTILEIARTGLAGLERGSENVIWIEE
jgi:acetolactate synthase-1/3 small subunit